MTALCESILDWGVSTACDHQKRLTETTNQSARQYIRALEMKIWQEEKNLAIKVVILKRRGPSADLFLYTICYKKNPPQK